MNKISAYLLLSVLLSLLFSACARLPEYARPQFSPEDNSVSTANSFMYRKLKEEDFKAESLPPKFKKINHAIQARSCISIQTSSDSQIHISSGTISGQIIYTGRFSSLIFAAAFNPDCSWWNPEISPERKSYILQHEQIHFALTELTARQLNRQYKEHMKDYLAVGNSLEDVKKQLHDEAERISRAGIEEAIEKHTSFDEETSLFYDPKIQQEWSDRVNLELSKETTP